MRGGSPQLALPRLELDWEAEGPVLHNRAGIPGLSFGFGPNGLMVWLGELHGRMEDRALHCA